MAIAAGGLGNQSHFKPKDKSQEWEKEGKESWSKNIQQVGENKRNCYAKRKSWWQKTSELQKAFQPLLSYLCTPCFLCASSCWYLSSAHHRKAIIVYWFICSWHKITAWSARSGCVICVPNSLAMAGVTWTAWKMLIENERFKSAQSSNCHEWFF